MKITNIEAIPVNVPLKDGMTTKTSHGIHATSPYVIIQVHTDSGLIGLGEATVAPRWSGETSASCTAAIEGLICDALTGMNPLNIQQCQYRMERVIKGNPFTKAAVEMALWDLLGKHCNEPVFRLLGGSVHEALPIRMVIGSYDVPQALVLAKKFIGEGTRCLKVKVGLDPLADIERVEAIRTFAGPDIPISVDANCGWTFDQAQRTIRELEQFDLLFVEQPIATDSPEQLAELRCRSNIPIMADESNFTTANALDLIRRDAVDILSVYPGKHGGILNTLKITALAAAAGIKCAVGSNLELGIGTAAMLHVGSAQPVIDSTTYPGDFIGPLYHVHDLLTESLSLGPPAAIVPDSAGLGVTLDHDALQRFKDDNASHISLG